MTMQTCLQFLHYAKAGLVMAKVLLCLALIARSYRTRRRGSLLMLIIGLGTAGLSVLISNYVNTFELFLSDRERSNQYADIFFAILFLSLVVCEIGLGWELASFLRRRKTADRGDA